MFDLEKEVDRLRAKIQQEFESFRAEVRQQLESIRSEAQKESESLRAAGTVARGEISQAGEAEAALISGFEVRVKDFEARLQANETIVDGVHALQTQLMEMASVIGGFDVIKDWYDRVSKELEQNLEYQKENTRRVQEFYERIAKYYTTALESFYKERDAAYGQLKPDVLVHEVVELLKQDAQAELEFRHNLIKEIAERIAARFHGAVPTRQASRQEIAASEPVLVTRQATQAEAKASMGA